jgi:hypothetical protein
MKDKSTHCNFFWASVITAILLAGCAGTSPSVTYYTLHAGSGMQTDNLPDNLGENIVIGMGPVVLPGYLERPQIVTRQGQNRIQLSEFHRWGTALTKDFSRVLAKNVSVLLPSHRVIVFPWSDDISPDYRIRLDVEQFDGRFGHCVSLNARWSVTGREGKELVARTSAIEEPLHTEDHDGLVAAMSRAIASLSGEITKEIQKLEATSRTP